MKRTIATFLIIALYMLQFPGIPGYGGTAYAESSIPAGFERVAQSDKLALYLNTQTNVIAIEDRRNGYLWKSAVDDKDYDMKSTSASWKSSMTSMFVISYAVTDTGKYVIQKAYASAEDTAAKVQKEGSGLRMDYQFDKLGLKLSLEIKLDGDSLTLRIPFEKIREESTNNIMSIEVLPFFGAADKSTDGYMVYPDGSGALMKYRNIDTRQKVLKTYRWDVYGPETVSGQEYMEMENARKYQAALPVFGIKNNANAVLAAATAGEGDAGINLSPEGHAVNLNRISFEFIYRHSFDMALSNITVNGLNTAKVLTVKKVDKDILRQDHEVRLMFLQGENADYSGMANIYRDYLIKNQGIKKAIPEKSEIPLALDLLMGVKEDRMIFDRFITMTSFDQAKEITGHFKDNGITNMQVKLKGWSKGGYGVYPVNWPPERALGGMSGLRDYAGYAVQNRIKLFLQTNFINAYAKNGGFSKRKDVVMQGDKLPVTDKLKEWFLMNPFVSLRRFKSFLHHISGLQNGVAMEEIGKVIYHDYNLKNPSSRMQTQEKWKETLQAASGTKGGIAVQGGNAYVLAYADRLFDIPTRTSDLYITDEAIPFYQMIVHGLIPYSSDPGNLFYDPGKQKLKWVEYGCMPYFELTYQRSLELKYTAYNRLFTSRYIEWVDEAARVYREFNDRLKGIWGEAMTEHEKISDTLYKVRYANNTVIYINYGENEARCDGYTVKALDYLVVERGGAIK